MPTRMVSLIAISLVGGAAAESPPPADERLICRKAERPLGSRIKFAPTCRTAAAWKAADEKAEERLPIGLQIKPQQAEPGQRQPR